MLRKHKTPAYYRCPVAIDFDSSISIYAKAVYHNFLAHRNNTTGACFPSAYVQAKEVRCGINKVCEARKELMKAGWIRKTILKTNEGKIDRYQWELAENPNVFPGYLLPESGFSIMRKSHNQVIDKLTNKKLNQEEILNKEEIEPAEDSFRFGRQQTGEPISIKDVLKKYANEYRRVQAREDQLNALRYRNKARA